VIAARKLSFSIAAMTSCAVLACAAEVLPDAAPHPTSVTPSSGHQPEETPVVILGDGFRVAPYQDANGRPRVDATFRAWLGATELAGVSWVSANELHARVPAGVPLGTHRLEVLGPGGGSGTLPAAFTVVPGTAASLGANATLVPGVAGVGEPVTLEVSVTNGGETAALGVALTVSQVGTAIELPAGLPLPVDVGPGATHVFQVVCTAASPGTAVVEVDVAGTDEATGEPVRAAHLSAGMVIVQVDEATKVLDDPFGDGTTFSFVFGYDGHVFLGPTGDGRGVVRCRPDGTGCASLAFSFERDVTGSMLLPELLTTVSENTACPSLTTLGASPYCDPVTPQTTPCACGPDYEVGRGLMGSFTLGSPPVEWLVAMGRTVKTGDLSYLYMTRDVASPLHFSYVDLYTALPQSANGESVSSMAVLDDRLYVGLQVVNGVLGGAMPRLVVLTRTPVPPGLDSGSADAFATTFQQTAMGESDAGISQVDAMLGFEGRLFVANRKAVLVSKTGSPTGAPDASTQFDDCTPPATGGWEATSIVKYTAKIDMTPADRGVTGLAAWQGRLYLGRNTRPVPPGTAPAVPELWAFTPRHDPDTGDFLGCAPTDWQLVATNFGSASSTALTALFASPSFLYVGYDDAVSGARLFRTDAIAPTHEDEFSGRLGCNAPCEPVGGSGLGDPANTRFFDARAIRFGGVDHVWATLGSGSGAVRAYRISE
jgi:hypothetical protein